ncbi:MAG: 1,4-dihydroxy-2-naphthoate polyprenyltransferase [Kofleriaceae bacterium]|nr:1,4-dihydroxy-2-naphthoate polyprenyltransferase [Kofleriaceae bacterium]MCB9573670.1 1,4-dihydroxy-2-naphthoate polyprenyltransferase [Kofleriaceae bacterium]
MTATPISSPISPARAWLLAARPATLTAAAAPVVVGTACAHAAGGVAAGPAAAALAGAALIQIGTNFANDVFDAEAGADGPDRLGPTRAVATGLLSAAQVRRGMIATFALAALCGVYLTAVAGWPVIAIGVASVLSGVAYTGGPWPLGYHGLGDVFVMAFFGFVAVCGTAFVQLGEVPALAAWLAVPVGALATAILVVNNLRDRAGDAVVGKRTLAVRLGRRAVIAEYALLVVAAHAVPVILWARGGGPWLLLPCATAPVAAALTVQVARRDGAALNPLLGATAKLLLANAALLALGVALA